MFEPKNNEEAFVAAVLRRNGKTEAEVESIIAETLKRRGTLAPDSDPIPGWDLVERARAYPEQLGEFDITTLVSIIDALNEDRCDFDCDHCRSD